MDRIEWHRLLQVLTYTGIFSTKRESGKPPAILYIGANRDRFHFRDALARKAGLGSAVDVVEIDGARCKDLEQDNPWLRRVVCGDVRAIEGLGLGHYDVALWLHGPEILEQVADVKSTLDSLLQMSKLLIVMCPWGEYRYPKGFKDRLSPYDINKLALYPEFFLSRGFAVHCIGEKGVNGSNLMAWKKF